MKMPDPGRKKRRQLSDLLADTPELVVVIDTFEQRVQRHKKCKQADEHFSGKNGVTKLSLRLTAIIVSSIPNGWLLLLAWSIVKITDRFPGLAA